MMFIHLLMVLTGLRKAVVHHGVEDMVIRLLYIVIKFGLLEGIMGPRGT